MNEFSLAKFMFYSFDSLDVGSKAILPLVACYG